MAARPGARSTALELWNVTRNVTAAGSGGWHCLAGDRLQGTEPVPRALQGPGPPRAGTDPLHGAESPSWPGDCRGTDSAPPGHGGDHPMSSPPHRSRPLTPGVPSSTSAQPSVHLLGARPAVIQCHDSSHTERFVKQYCNFISCSCNEERNLLIAAADCRIPGGNASPAPSRSLLIKIKLITKHKEALG